jgi:preprotein translocase subunit Sec63
MFLEDAKKTFIHIHTMTFLWFLTNDKIDEVIKIRSKSHLTIVQ